MRRELLVLAALGAAAGCASVLPDPAPAPRIFELPAEAAPTPGVTTRAEVLAVAFPDMSAALSGLDIAWVRDGEIAYMERSAWPSRTPDALRALLIETIDAQDLVAAAVPAGVGVRADAEIRWTVQAFQIDERDGDLTARFRADVKLMDVRSRRIVAATAVSREAPLAERSASLAAQTLTEVAQAGAREIGAWAAAQTPHRPSPDDLMGSGEKPAAAPAPDQPSAASISR